MAQSILLGILGLVAAVANVAFWMFVVTRGQRRFQHLVERKFSVVIDIGHKGHWRVSGDGSWLRRLAIELLQLGYFSIAFAGWAVAVLLAARVFSVAAP